VFERWLIVALLASPLCVLAVEDRPKTPQQEQKAACSKEAGDRALKGDDRKKFMSECRSAANVSHQEKMKSCNRDAAGKALKGDERKKFMSQCLKGPTKS